MNMKTYTPDEIKYMKEMARRVKIQIAATCSCCGEVIKANTEGYWIQGGESFAPAMFHIFCYKQTTKEGD